MCGYVCINCGRCKGVKKMAPAWTCVLCGEPHAAGVEACTACGAKITPPPGAPGTPGAPSPGNRGTAVA